MDETPFGCVTERQTAKAHLRNGRREFRTVVPARTEKQDRQSLHRQGMGFASGASRVRTPPQWQQCRPSGQRVASNQSSGNAPFSISWWNMPTSITPTNTELALIPLRPSSRAIPLIKLSLAALGRPARRIPIGPDKI